MTKKAHNNQALATSKHISKIQTSLRDIFSDKIHQALTKDLENLSQIWEKIEHKLEHINKECTGPFYADNYLANLETYSPEVLPDWDLIRQVFGELVDIFEASIKDIPPAQTEVLKKRFWKEVLLNLILEGADNRNSTQSSLETSNDGDPNESNLALESKGLGKKNQKSIISGLELDNFQQFSRETRTKLFSQFKNIQRIEIKRGFLANLDDDFFEQLQEHFTQVTHIVISQGVIDKMSDSMLQKLGNCFPYITTLTVDGAYGLSLTYGKLEILYSRFPQVQVLHSRPPHSVNGELACIYRNFPALQYLEYEIKNERDSGDFGKTFGLIVEGLVALKIHERGTMTLAIRQALAQGKNLRYLSFQSNVLHNLKPKEIEDFFAQMPQLKHLALNENLDLFETRQKVCAFLTVAKKLHSLEIKYFPLAKARDQIAYFLQQLPDLHTLKVENFWPFGLQTTLVQEEIDDLVSFLAGAIHIPHLFLEGAPLENIPVEILKLVFSHPANHIQTLKLNPTSKSFLLEHVPEMAEKLR